MCYEVSVTSNITANVRVPKKPLNLLCCPKRSTNFLCPIKSITSFLACLLLILCTAPIAHCQTEFEKTKEKAEQGHAEAQFNLGVMHSSGEGTLRDPKKAFNWYKKAAEQGYDRAQYNLGIMYYLGEGTQKDLKKTIEWYTRAAEQGNCMAQYRLGCMYFIGKGTPKDHKKAARWIENASESIFPEVKVAAEKAWNEHELWKYAE